MNWNRIVCASLGIAFVGPTTIGCVSSKASKVANPSPVWSATTKEAERKSDSQTAENEAEPQKEAHVVPVSFVEPAKAMTTAELSIEPDLREQGPQLEHEGQELLDYSNAKRIDLTTALLLTTGQNPQVAFAHARIEEAMAQWERANSLKLPSIRAGINYNKHEGRIQDVAGSVIETSRGSFYSGLGANAVGAGSPAVPGIVSQFHFADAIFQPRIAQRTACARQAGAMAVSNDALLATALAYVELLRTHQELSVAREIAGQADRLVQVTGEFQRVGQGLASDHDRARTELALRRNEVLRSEENAAIASARLAELLRWDSGELLVPEEDQLIPIKLLVTPLDSRELVLLALSNRPELIESRHLVGEAIERLRREKNAPLVPSVLLAASYGGLGGGLGSDLSQYGDRLDADAMAYWEIRQLGIGERAFHREAKARISQAKFREMAQLDLISREVVQAHAQTRSRAKQVQIAKEAIELATLSYERNWSRIENGEGLPIEVLQAMQALALARREYLRVVADYNVAQFTLHRALGWPIDGPEMDQP